MSLRYLAAHGVRAVLLCSMLSVGAHAQTPATSDPHAGHTPTPAAELPPFIPRLTDEDRQATFPDLGGHTVHDRAINFFVLVDQIEWQRSGTQAGLAIDTKGWIGRDRDRFWFRTEGDSEGARVDEAQAHALYGRQISRWWDVVAGVRQDVRPGPAQTWLAIGLQGLAPYWFEVEATGYVGPGGRTQARFEVEYDLRLSQRLVVQPLAELELRGQADAARGLTAGLGATNFGLRLRYEVKREFAPYVGVMWGNTRGTTADIAEAAGNATGGARFVSGLRLWF